MSTGKLEKKNKINKKLTVHEMDIRMEYEAAGIHLQELCNTVRNRMA